MSDLTGRCAIGQREHGAVVGYLCEGHLQRLSAMLRDIEDEAALLDPVPSFQQRTGNRGGSLASHRSPARLDVLVHTDRRRGTGKSEDDVDALAAGDTLPILDVLHSWSRIVREERQLYPPDRVTISGERGLLTAQLEWIARQPWVDECFDEIRTLLAQLRGINGTLPDRPYSSCPVIRDGQSCAGQVWIHDEFQLVWRRYPDRCARDWEQAPGAAMCDTCGAKWSTEGEKARLKRMIDDKASELDKPRTADGEPMLTVEEIAERLGKSVNAVRIMASRIGVKAVDGHFDPQAFGLARHVA